MKAALVMASVSRNAGGLMPVARRLSQGLAARPTNQVRVLGLRDEHAESDRSLWDPVEVVLCEPRGPGALGYSPDYERELARFQPELVHQHGIWTFASRSTSRYCQRAGVPWVVSLHGMIEPWALKNGRWKKRLAWLAYQKQNLRRASCLLVTSEPEVQYVRKLGIESPIAVVDNAVDPVLPVAVRPRSWATIRKDQKVVLFLGRLHPKKGLFELVEGWALLARRQPALGARWSLVITGWDDGGHEPRLRERLDALGLREPEVCVTGPAFGEERDQALGSASAFILPSFGEGMPMAALEALSAGVPLLVSDECNLPVVFDSQAGVRAPASAEGVAGALERFLKLTDEERVEMGRHATTLAAERFSWPRITGHVERIYQWVLRQGPRPDDLLR